MNYDHKSIESKWQKVWNETKIYQDYSKEKKFYALDMFPYPSGEGLHVGHPKGYIATDVTARFKILNGYSVLHPMGWDAFGLPAENYAIKNKVHPRVAVEKNVARYKEQLQMFGFTYDWDREINTTDPEYYRWTQWIFLQMFERGLAFESDEPVNWCPSCKTVLANEDLEGGFCERCGTQVVQKKMRQWVLKMTEYADRLLYDLDKEDLDWEEMIKEQQRNWIGRSEGAEFAMQIKSPHTPLNKGGESNEAPFAKGGAGEFISVYTTRLDTVYGMTYAVVAPEHEIIQTLKDKIENYNEVEAYIIKAQNKTSLERTELQKEKTGVELKGIKAVNPFTDKEIPLFVGDYVLGGYGTGAVMAVPAHDERDFEFAKKYNLEIKTVIAPLTKGVGGLKNAGEGNNPPGPLSQGGELDKAFTDDGILVNSENYDGLTSEQAREKMAAWLEEKGIGKKKVNYKMRDWVFSRQRYWGEPMPLVFCPDCKKLVENYKIKITNSKQARDSKFKIQNFEFSAGEILNPGWIGVEKLPVELPDVESYEPTGTGESPLANISEWVNTKCPKCGGEAKRETNTMPQWAGSCWYYLAYVMRGISNFQAPISKYKEEFDKWLPIDLYVGGAEHATRHLLYARFWHKFLYDIGAVTTKEPFKKLVHVGLINAEDGRKMSKRWNNVVNPDEIIAEFGADSIRLYEMFMGPFIQNIAWSTKGVIGVRRFLEKVWKLRDRITNYELRITNKKIEPLLHKTIKKVTEDIENFRFNTAISSMMILANAFEKEEKIPKDDYEKFLMLLSPFAPHIAEELWQGLGHGESVFKQAWPVYDPAMVKDETVKLVLQVNGKVRDTVEAPADISDDDARQLALENEAAKKWIDGKEILKVIIVKNKLVNIVVK